MKKTREKSEQEKKKEKENASQGALAPGPLKRNVKKDNKLEGENCSCYMAGWQVKRVRSQESHQLR